MRAITTAMISIMLVLSLSAGATGKEQGFTGIDREEDCQEWVPEQHSTPVDAVSPVTLRVMVLLDGIDAQSAREVARIAATAYEPLQISLQAVRLKKMHFPPSGVDANGNPEIDGYQYMEAIKAAMGGTVPKGADAVYSITNKTMFFMENGQKVYGLAGLADCIGGIRYANRSFSLGAGPKETWTPEDAGLTMAHELGHLLGAHHHYANCVEGPAPELCTVMFNANLSFLRVADFNSLKFGTLEASVITGHAQAYLTP